MFTFLSALTGNFGLKTQNKDKRENKIKAHKNHNAKDLKKLKKRDPTKTPMLELLIL
jgi:hypothetical protein